MKGNALGKAPLKIDVVIFFTFCLQSFEYCVNGNSRIGTSCSGADMAELGER